MGRRVTKRMWRLLVIPLAIPLMAALNILVDEAHNKIMPDEGSVPVGTILTVKKGDIFYRQPLGREHATRLESDVSFSFLGSAVALAKGDQLIQSEISGTAADQFTSQDALFCTVAKRTGKKRVVGLSELADIGMDLDAIAKLRHIQTQTCVVDVGGNGTADKAFVADTSNRQEIVPVLIPPTPLKKLGLARMPGESEARMLFDGPVGILGNMSTSFQVVEEGKLLAFGNGQTIFRASPLPHTVEEFGGMFTILSYDKKSKTAQIRIDQPFASLEYHVKTEIRYR